MKKDNAACVVTKLINELQINITHQSIVDELEKHPDYPSLLAISDVLNNWNVPNAAYQLEFELLFDVPVPFIAHFLSNGGEFVLVKQISHEKAIVYKEGRNDNIVSINEFKKEYNGYILIAEKDSQSGEQDYSEKRTAELISEWRVPLMIAGSLVFFAEIFLLDFSRSALFNYQLVLLTLFKTLGLITSILLLIQSIDADNPLIQKVCGRDNNNSCNAILSSKAAKIYNWLSWSEVGFIYFSASWLVLIFNPGNTMALQLLAGMNLLSLPYTFYSIYYQLKIAMQWCLFCCIVQALLWLEFLVLYPYLLAPIKFSSLLNLGLLLAEMLLPVLIWAFLKPYFLSAKQSEALKSQLRQFKYNSELFQTLLNNEQKYQLPDEGYSIILGNTLAANTVTMVSSPFCQPCAKMHKKLVEWLANRDEIKLQIIFATHDGDHKRTEVAIHFLALKAANNVVFLKHALDDWYEQKQKSYEAWAKIYPVKEIQANLQALQKQREWCDLTEITSTPTLFINGRKLPKKYKVEDIKYFI